MRKVIRCPSCFHLFVNRRNQACPKCKVGVKFKGEFIYKGDYFIDTNGYGTSYSDLSNLDI